MADPTTSPQKTRTRERLIEAAREEFGDCGIEAATTRGIAQRAGCNEVTLFRHFETKQKLLAAVVRETSHAFQELCTCQTGFSGDLRADIERFARVYNESFENCEGMARALIAASHRRPMLARELVGDVIEPFHCSIATCLEQAKQARKVRADLDSRAFAEILTATIMGGVLRRHSGLSDFDRETWLREIVGLLLHGIEA